MDYVASLSAFQPGREDWADLARDLGEALEGPGLLHGVTPLARGGLLARILAPTAPALSRAVFVSWSLCRRELLGLPPLHLRKL
jgi:urease accessory protein UreH